MLCAFPCIFKDGWNKLPIEGKFYKINTDDAWVTHVLSVHGDSFYMWKLQMITDETEKKRLGTNVI